MIPFLIALTLWTAAFVAVGVVYELDQEPPRSAAEAPAPLTPHKEQAP